MRHVWIFRMISCLSSSSPSVSGRIADWKRITKISSKALHPYHNCPVPMPFHTLVKAFADMLVSLVNWFCGMSLCRNPQPQRSTAPVWGLLPTAVMRSTKILLCQMNFSTPMSPACFQDACARLKQVCNHQARDVVSEVQGQAPVLSQTQWCSLHL